jgi:hypothetical protein
MPWYFYLFEFVSGLFLANGVPHFVQGISGHRFQSPFGYPPGVGESSPLSNTLWGFANLTVGFILLRFFAPQNSAVGWIPVALGVLLAAIWLSAYFGGVRLRHAGKFSQRQARLRSAQSFVKGFSIERLACGEPRTTRIISMRARNVAGTWRCPE